MHLASSAHLRERHTAPNPKSRTRCEDWTVGGSPDQIAVVRVLGDVCAVAADGSVIDLPSPSQRRLLGLLALHAPRRLRSEMLADVLGVSPGALRTTVSRLRSALGLDVLLTSSTGYALECDVDACRSSATPSLRPPAPRIGYSPFSRR